jgi:hypothetical protein
MHPKTGIMKLEGANDLKRFNEMRRIGRIDPMRDTSFLQINRFEASNCWKRERIERQVQAARDYNRNSGLNREVYFFDWSPGVRLHTSISRVRVCVKSYAGLLLGSKKRRASAASQWFKGSSGVGSWKEWA